MALARSEIWLSQTDQNGRQRTFEIRSHLTQRFCRFTCWRQWFGHRIFAKTYAVEIIKVFWKECNLFLNLYSEASKLLILVVIKVNLFVCIELFLYLEDRSIYQKDLANFISAQPNCVSLQTPGNDWPAEMFLWHLALSLSSAFNEATLAFWHFGVLACCMLDYSSYFLIISIPITLLYIVTLPFHSAPPFPLSVFK